MSAGSFNISGHKINASNASSTLTNQLDLTKDEKEEEKIDLLLKTGSFQDKEPLVEDNFFSKTRSSINLDDD